MLEGWQGVGTMSKEQFENELLKLGATVEEFNTNNAWGFGGGTGKRFTVGDCVVSQGVASTRHAGTFPFVTVKYDYTRIFDKPDSAKSRAEALKIVAELNNQKL